MFDLFWDYYFELANTGVNTKSWFDLNSVGSSVFAMFDIRNVNYFYKVYVKFLC